MPSIEITAEQAAERAAMRSELRSGVAQFLREQAGPEQRRSAIAAPTGFDERLHQRLVAELGLGAVAVPEALDGLGLGSADAFAVVEELGRALACTPLVDGLVVTAALADALRAAEPAAHSAPQSPTESRTGPVASALFTAVGAGEIVSIGGLTPVPDGSALILDGDRLSGTAYALAFGASATHLVLVVGDGSEAAVVVVDPSADGVHLAALPALDHTRQLATASFENATAARLGGSALAHRLRHTAMVFQAGESAAAATACLADTVGYLKVREQFGTVIGSFQALKHRAADLAVLAHEATCTARYAAAILGGEQEPAVAGDALELLAPLAKTVGSDALFAVAADCIQLHGGIGFTFEQDMHLYFKRGKANQLLLTPNSVLRNGIGRRLGL